MKKEHSTMQWGDCLFILMSFLIMLTLCGCSKNESDTVYFPKDSEEYIGHNYESVVSHLHEASFSNIDSMVFAASKQMVIFFHVFSWTFRLGISEKTAFLRFG